MSLWPKVTAFTAGFEEYVSDANNLLLCLKPWVNGRERDGERGSGRPFYGQQDTLVKLLLGVDHVQTQLLECLVGKMAEHAEESETERDGESVPRLCLQQVPLSLSLSLSLSVCVCVCARACFSVSL